MVGQFLGRWLTDCRQPSVRPSALRSYRDTVRLHIAPVLGKLALAILSPPHVQAFIRAQLAVGLSPRSVQHHYSVLSWALNHLKFKALVAGKEIRGSFQCGRRQTGARARKRRKPATAPH